MEQYRFHADGALFYVTFSVVDWLPIFISENACKIVTDSLNFCHRQKGLRINAYVIMPTHLHAILFHEDTVAGVETFGRAERRGQETRADRGGDPPRARSMTLSPPGAYSCHGFP